MFSDHNNDVQSNFRCFDWIWEVAGFTVYLPDNVISFLFDCKTDTTSNFPYVYRYFDSIYLLRLSESHFNYSNQIRILPYLGPIP